MNDWYTRVVYSIRDKKTNQYDGNNTIGIFEFLTEKNARKYIKQEKLKNRQIIEITTHTKESYKII